jgi:hypothetical protein
LKALVVLDLFVLNFQIFFSNFIFIRRLENDISLGFNFSVVVVRLRFVILWLSDVNHPSPHINGFLLFELD